jgi:hypothetical protein
LTITVAFEKRHGPNPVVAIILFLIIMILPGLIYIIVARGRSVVTVTANRSGERTNVLMSWTGKADGAAHKFVEYMQKTEPKVTAA